jgi:hypothetical protein
LLCVIVVVVLGVLSRLPQLMSPELFLDSDECVSGLMSLHLYQGRELPVFFYGQRYGLSIIENLAGALGFAALGVGPVALKAAMLGLWLTGAVFAFLCLAEWCGPRVALLGTLLLLCMPAWAVWSMKARGGYLTAFVAAHAVAFLLARRRQRLTAGVACAVGLLTGLAACAQPLWVPGLLPSLVWSWWQGGRRWRQAAAAAARCCSGRSSSTAARRCWRAG